MSLTKKKHDIRKFRDCIRSDSEKGDTEKKKKKKKKNNNNNFLLI